MRGVVMYTAGDVRVEERDDPKIIEPHRRDHPAHRHLHLRIGPVALPRRRTRRPQVMGHEYVGVVEEIGDQVRNVEVGDFVVGSFVISDNTCEIFRSGFQSQCVNASFASQIGTQSERPASPTPTAPSCPRPGSRPPS